MLRTGRADRATRNRETGAPASLARLSGADGSTRKRNPTAVQSGNRHATPLGERRRENRRRQTVCVKAESQDLLHAERTEAGPGPGATCRQNRSDTRTGSSSARSRGRRNDPAGPRGDVASHFVGLLVFTGIRHGAADLLQCGRSVPPPRIRDARSVRSHFARRSFTRRSYLFGPKCWPLLHATRKSKTIGSHVPPHTR